MSRKTSLCENCKKYASLVNIKIKDLRNPQLPETIHWWCNRCIDANANKGYPIFDWVEMSKTMMNEWKSFSDKKPPVNKRVVIQREHNKKMVVARFKKKGPRKDLPTQDLWYTEHGSYYLIDAKDTWILIPGLE